ATPRPARIGVSIATALGAPLFLCAAECTSSKPVWIGGRDIIRLTIPRLPLTAGVYLLSLFLERDGVIDDWLIDATSLQVEDGDFFGFGRNTSHGWEGKAVLVEHSWTIGGESADRSVNDLRNIEQD